MEDSNMQELRRGLSGFVNLLENNAIRLRTAIVDALPETAADADWWLDRVDELLEDTHNLADAIGRGAGRVRDELKKEVQE